MKPDINKKENLEEEYQRPPLREEIEKFFSEAKAVAKFVAMGLGVFFLISIRDSILPIIQKIVRFVVDWANAIFVDFINTLQALMEWTNKHPEQFFGFIASVGLLGFCYYLIMTSLKHRLALIADFYPDKLSIITYDEFFLKFRTYKEIEDVYTISFKDDDLYTIYSKRVKEAMDKMTSSSIVNEEQLQQIFLDYFE